MKRIKLIQLVKEVIAEQQLNENYIATQILKKAKAAIENGSEVTVLGTPIKKVVVAGGAFFPADGSASIRIPDIEDLTSDILIDGEPIEIEIPEPKPYIDTRTPEEIEAAIQAHMDRYGPGGGQDTAFGRRTFD